VHTKTTPIQLCNITMSKPIHVHLEVCDGTNSHCTIRPQGEAYCVWQLIQYSRFTNLGVQWGM